MDQIDRDHLRRETIEECAQVAESLTGRVRGPIAKEVAQAIRAIPWMEKPGASPSPAPSTFSLPADAPWTVSVGYDAPPNAFPFAVEAATGEIVAVTLDEDTAKLIASIPDMVKENERLEGRYRDEQKDNDRLRARNAELCEAIERYLADDYSCNGGAEMMFRAILAKDKEEAPAR